MNDSNRDVPIDASFAEEMEELKRDMQSARLMALLQKYKNTLLMVAVALLLALLAGSIWLENKKSQRASAASLYYQALTAVDEKSRAALMGAVDARFSDTGYAALATLQQASGEKKAAILAAVIQRKDLPDEIVWQARLDLAEHYIAQSETDKANVLLAERVGKQYEELRYYLLYVAASDKAAKIEALEKALMSASNDADLQLQMKRALASLTRGDSE